MQARFHRNSRRKPPNSFGWVILRLVYINLLVWNGIFNLIKNHIYAIPYFIINFVFYQIKNS